MIGMLIPLMIVGGFDGVEPRREVVHNYSEGSYRALARVLHRSPSHICRVINGERASASLLAAIKRAQGKKGGK